MGTPDFAVPALEKIIERHEVIAVVTQPDKPKDRGGRAQFGEVKSAALKSGLPIYQFMKIRIDGVEVLKALQPDVMVTAAYGQILSQEILDIPKYGVLNIHASMLPKYRGSAPIQWAIVKGERETGVTIMQTALGIDCGQTCLSKSIPIELNDTAGTMFDKLKNLGAELIIEALDLLAKSKLVFENQDEARATHYPMIKKSDGLIDWKKSSHEIFNIVRGFNPWPTAYSYLNGLFIKIYECEPIDGDFSGLNGQIVKANLKEGLIVKCGSGYLKIKQLQTPNKKRMTVKEYLNGNAVNVGDVFGDIDE